MTKIGFVAMALWLASLIGVGMGSFMHSLAPSATNHIDLYIHFGADEILQLHLINENA